VRSSTKKVRGQEERPKRRGTLAASAGEECRKGFASVTVLVRRIGPEPGRRERPAAWVTTITCQRPGGRHGRRCAGGPLDRAGRYGGEKKYSGVPMWPLTDPGLNDAHADRACGLISGSDKRLTLQGARPVLGAGGGVLGRKHRELVHGEGRWLDRVNAGRARISLWIHLQRATSSMSVIEEASAGTSMARSAVRRSGRVRRQA